MTLLPGSSCAVVLQQAIGLSLKSKSSFKIQVTLLPARLWLEPRWASLHNVVAARKGEDTWDVFCMKDISSLSILLGVQIYHTPLMKVVWRKYFQILARLLKLRLSRMK
ncbi:uncharacterized protein LOC107858893 isoform X1 [Capsicum annuum]|uniref:uncharacterized protein LOC107858893 isoform X1 n=1 Tax=Capsicum annuum TaxID=4072 RepID=UPI001FB121D7|nr:uncharacterized protein LOC107858893 isoform X1 [Capsicum annuum]